MPRDSFFNIKSIFQDRRKLTVFLICLGISGLMWLLISLGKEYNTTILVPVKFSNFPENKTLLNEVQKHLAVNVSGNGYDIIKYEDRLQDDTLVINLNNLNIAVIGGYQQGALDPAIIGKELQERLNGMLAINRVLTDSLKFIFDLKVSRTVQIKPRINYTIPKGYTLLDSIYAVPYEVEVTGALSILDTLHFVETEVVDLGEINKNKKITAYLSRNVLGEDAFLSQDSVALIVNIDQLTEKSFLMEPSFRNVPDSIELLLFPRSVEVIMQVPLSRFDQVSDEDIELYVDFKDYNIEQPTLPLKLEAWPVMAKKVSLKEQRVEVVLNRILE